MMRKAAWMGILAAVLMAGAGLGAPLAVEPATPVIIAEMQAALDKGDAHQAAALAEAGLKEIGVSAVERGRLLLYRGLARELLGAYEEAVGDFTQALATNSLPPNERAQALLQRGFLQDGQGRLDQASADYTAVIAMKGEGFATALNNRANIFRRQNRLMEARRDYLAALSVGSGKPQYSYYGLGQIAEALHDTITARSSYTKALAADPDYSLASERLAALGGPSDSAIADAGKVTLRPPATSASPADMRNFRAVTEASREPDRTIVLRAPRGSGGDTVTSRPLATTGRAATSTLQPRAPAPPAGHKVRGLALRPALDQWGTAPVRGAGEVQLGAWRTQAEADAGWGKAKAVAPRALVGLNSHVVLADLPGKGRYYRLRVSPGPGQSQVGLCDSLMASGLACLPVRD